MTATGFLGIPEPTADALRLFEEDIDELGYVMNATTFWAYQPGVMTGLFDLMRQTISGYQLDIRQRGILVAACASTLGDAYCSLAWGSKLAAATDAHTAAGVIRGDDDQLSGNEKAMAGWARRVTRDPNGIGVGDVQLLRDVGFTDAQIFAITVFVSLRMAFSTINDALGMRPDAEFRATAPSEVLAAVTFGRAIAEPSR